MQFHVLRTPPGRGNVTVDWKIIGQNLELTFANVTGQLFFCEVIPQRKVSPQISRKKKLYFEENGIENQYYL